MGKKCQYILNKSIRLLFKKYKLHTINISSHNNIVKSNRLQLIKQLLEYINNNNS